MKDIFKLPTGECLGVELKKKRCDESIDRLFTSRLR